MYDHRVPQIPLAAPGERAPAAHGRQGTRPSCSYPSAGQLILPFTRALLACAGLNSTLRITSGFPCPGKDPDPPVWLLPHKTSSPAMQPPHGSLSPVCVTLTPAFAHAKPSLLVLFLISAPSTQSHFFREAFLDHLGPRGTSLFLHLLSLLLIQPWIHSNNIYRTSMC